MTMMRSFVVYFCFVLVLAPAVVGGEQETAMLPHGISVKIPLDWRRAEAWEFERSQKSQEYANPEVMERAQKAAPMETLLAIAKHPSDHEGFNPSILVTRTEIPEKLKGINAGKLVEAMLPIFTHGFFDVRVEEWMPSIKVGGRPAARATTTYSTHSKSGLVTQCRASVVIVIIGNHFVMFGMSSPAAGEDDAREQFEQFVATISFKDAA